MKKQIIKRVVLKLSFLFYPLLVIFVSNTQASVTLGIFDTIGASTSISINPGETFDINVNSTVTAASNVIGFTYFLRSSGPSTSVFSITGRSNVGSLFTDLQTPGTTPITVPSNLLDPANNSDLGASEPNLTSQGPGNYFVSSFTISSSLAIPIGVYTISFVPSTAVYVDGAFSTNSFDSLGDYTVTVIPEPTTMALLAGSLTAIMVLRRRRRTS